MVRNSFSVSIHSTAMGNPQLQSRPHTLNREREMLSLQASWENGLPNIHTVVTGASTRHLDSDEIKWYIMQLRNDEASSDDSGWIIAREKKDLEAICDIIYGRTLVLLLFSDGVVVVVVVGLLGEGKKKMMMFKETVVQERRWWGTHTQTRTGQDTTLCEGGG